MTCTQCLSWAGTVYSLSGDFMSTEIDSPEAEKLAVEEGRDTLGNQEQPGLQQTEGGHYLSTKQSP